MRVVALTVCSIVLVAGFGGVASATPEDYCAAYAVDFANAGPEGQAIWQQRFDNASKDCLQQYEKKPAVAAIKKKHADIAAEPDLKPKPKLQIKPKLAVKTKPKPTIEPVAMKSKDVKRVAAEEVKTSGVISKPEPGSPAWLDYCKRKYVSFNEAKGTYLSKTGIERKCLITADFR